MYDTVIRDGTVVAAESITEMDIGIQNGRIAALSERNTLEDANTVIDAAGSYVFPGFIDSHVHVKIPLGEFVTNDDFSEVTRAAAYGGTTTIIDFAIPDPGESSLEAYERKREDADGSVFVDYGLHACVTEVSETILQELPELIERGASSVKMFMVYEGRLRLTHGEIRDVLEMLTEENGLALVHAEDQEIIAREVDAHVQAGITDYTNHPATHPNVSETTAMWTITELVDVTECPTYFVHVSTEDARNVLESARHRELPIIGETCPHYLSLSAEVYQRDNGENFVCSPPIRSAESAEELWKLADEDLIQTVNSDHCGYDTAQKQRFQADITKMPNGLPGVETKNYITYSEGVGKGRLSLQEFVQLTSTNTAKIFGLYPQKGSVAVGSDADLVVYDPDEKWTLTADDLHMETDYTPFEGFEISGTVAMTMVGGEIVVRDGDLVGEEGGGQFVKTDATDAKQTFRGGALQ
jgi:dihydropyrimidinase